MHRRGFCPLKERDWSKQKDFYEIYEPLSVDSFWNFFTQSVLESKLQSYASILDEKINIGAKLRDLPKGVFYEKLLCSFKLKITKLRSKHYYPQKRQGNAKNKSSLALRLLNRNAALRNASTLQLKTSRWMKFLNPYLFLNSLSSLKNCFSSNKKENWIKLLLLEIFLFSWM